ncbi:MAG: lactate racemase domain-containing protein [Puniceicoccaceae bacterium]
MSTWIEKGSAHGQINDSDLRQDLDRLLAKLATGAQKVLLIPPDHTRLNSRAGEITAYLYGQLKDRAEVRIMPALGTHFEMTPEQLRMMFGGTVPLDAFIAHDWRNSLLPLGEVPADRIRELSEGRLDFPMQVAVNRELFEGNYDLILSIGQIVPHEVIGMANYTKNIMIGVGGGDTINKSHYLGAVYGMERIMGETESPVRSALNEGFDTFVRPKVNMHFIFTVIGKDGDDLALKGLYAGDDHETFAKACELSRAVNLDKLEKPINKCVVYLDPEEFTSTWLGNKAVYRTRKAMADDGELVILAPALHTCGEDPEIDRLIRKYGYRGTSHTLKAVEDNAELAENLSAAAHLIHGTSDGRFRIIYCPGEGVSREVIEGVGFEYRTYADAVAEYDPQQLKDGWNTVHGEEIFYVSNPALGLWTL